MASELPNFQDYATEAPRPTVPAVDKEWGMYAHMSALAGVPLLGLTFLGPLALKQFKKPLTPFVEAHVKEALNFQIGVVVVYLLTLPLAFFTGGVSLILSFGILLYGGVMAIMAGMKASEGQMYLYPACFRLLK